MTAHPISSPGAIAVDQTLIGLGRRYAGLEATVFRTGDHVAAFHGHQLLRQLIIDRSKRYQPRTDLA